MSDLGFTFAPAAFSLLDNLPRPSSFQPDRRFGKGTVVQPPEPEDLDDPLPDPVAEAYSRGFEAGHHQATHEAAAVAKANAQAHEGLSLAFARLDKRLEEELRLRLRDTVAALCEAAIAPLALDEEALLRRVTRAADMLARADDNRVIRLHPDDLHLLSEQLNTQWQVRPDPQLERGTIRVDGAHGGVEDGPETWRRAIREALHQC